MEDAMKRFQKFLLRQRAAVVGGSMLALGTASSMAQTVAWTVPADLEPSKIATDAGTAVAPYVGIMITAGLALTFGGVLWRLISRKAARIGR